MTPRVQKNVPIVSVSEPEKEAEETVASKALGEGLFGFFQILLENVAENLVQGHRRVVFFEGVETD